MRLARDRRIAALGDIEETAAQVRSAERERDRLARRFVGDGLVGRIAVALHDAAITIEQLERVDRAATGGRVMIGGRAAERIGRSSMRKGILT